MIDLIASLCTVVLLTVGVAARPTRGECPPGWYLPEGVRTQPFAGRPTGSYACTRPPIGGHDDVLTGRSTAISPPGIVWSRIYCSGTMPIVVNHRVVGCQHVPGS